MYDWANSAYSTFQITILQVYLLRVVLPGAPGEIAYGYSIGISTLIAAVLSPILGAVADAHASKRFWLTVATLAGAGAGIAMYFVPLERSWVFVALFFTTSLSFEVAWGIYNAFLPEIADETSMNRVSSYGFALGYVGGGLALVIGVVVLLFGDALGLPSASPSERDFVHGNRLEFQVDLANGDYDASLTFGDSTSAHEGMRVSLNGESVDEVSTARAHFVTRNYRVVVQHDSLDVVVEPRLIHSSPAAFEREQVVLNRMEITGPGLAEALVFDFGTPDSPADEGTLWVTHEDSLAEYDREALAKRARVYRRNVCPSILRSGSSQGPWGSAAGIRC